MSITKLDTVILGLNAIDEKSWTTHRVESLHQFLVETFGQRFPIGGRIFHEKRDDAHDVTPIDEASAHRLLDLHGTFWVVIYPKSPAQFAVSFSLLMVSVALGFLFPRDKKDPARPPRQGSPNNTLGNRQNTSRLLGRISDIYGTVRATPDLVAIPWVYYENNRETEICVMCLGRGSYEVSSFNVYEGDMRAETIADLSVEIYPPGVLPGFGSPDVQIGPPIGFQVYNVYRVAGVIGQQLFSRNAFTIHGSIPFPEDPEIDAEFGVLYKFMAFFYSGAGIGHIYVPYRDGDPTEVTDNILVGDILECRFASSRCTRFPKERARRDIVAQSTFVGNIPNLSDDNLGYEVLSLSTVVFSGVDDYVDIEIAIPAGKQTDWGNIESFNDPAQDGVFCSGVLLTPLRRSATEYRNDIGPFFVDDPTMTSINCNFVAERGLYIDDTKNTRKIDVGITVTVTPANAVGVASGPPEEFNFILKGNSADLSTKALTAVIAPSFTGRCLVKAIRTDLGYWRVNDIGQNQRLSSRYPDRKLDIQGEDNGGVDPYPPSDWNPTGPYTTVTGLIQDEVKWTHCYSFSDPGVPAFEDTTLVMTKTIASRATNLIKQRKLSMFATRKIPTWNGSTFGGPLTASEFPEDIFMSILKDPLLGNLPNSQIDFIGIAGAFQAVRTYFGDNVNRFCHTFDSENTTLEEMLAAVAESSFCIAYREGQIIKVKPDIVQDNSVLIFNHRNIKKDTQSLTVAFGTEADYDGVKVDYFDDSANTIKTLVVPNDGATRPREIGIAGLRDEMRAAIHAWRAYHHILHQHSAIEFEATSEAALTLINDRILVADLTRVERQDGDVLSVSGATIVTSQPVDISGGDHTIFLQRNDGTVIDIPILSIVGQRTLTLASAPGSLQIDDAAGVRAKYAVVKDSAPRTAAYMVQDKSASGQLTWSIKAHNYAHSYFLVDGLQLWIAPKYNSLLEDVSPYGRLTTVTGGSSSGDVTRGIVLSSGLGDTIAVAVAPGTDTITGYTSYTKMCWVFKNATGSAVDLISMTGVAANEERFLISTGETVRVFHGGVAHVTMNSFQLGVWHHLAVTFNNTGGVLRLFYDGEMVDEATSIAAPGSRTGLVVMDNLDGLADDIRLYRRAMSKEEVREHYMKSRIL